MSPDSGDGGKSDGLFGSLCAMGATLLAILHNRVELLSTEFEEERIRLTSILVWSLVMLFCAALGIIFATLLLVLALWDDHRLLAVGIPTILYILAALFAWRVVADKARAKPRLFSASLAELAKDRERLTPRS
jgi:uncharacterized membrane protein YqjE